MNSQTLSEDSHVQQAEEHQESGLSIGMFYALFLIVAHFSV